MVHYAVACYKDSTYVGTTPKFDTIIKACQCAYISIIRQVELSSSVYKSIKRYHRYYDLDKEYAKIFKNWVSFEKFKYKVRLWYDEGCPPVIDNVKLITFE